MRCKGDQGQKKKKEKEEKSNAFVYPKRSQTTSMLYSYQRPVLRPTVCLPIQIDRRCQPSCHMNAWKERGSRYPEVPSIVPDWQ